jgi:hypothetical protein
MAIKDRIGQAWGGLGGEGQAQLIGGGIGALGSMISGGEDRGDALARDQYVRQLAAFNALQQNPYSQAMALQKANNMRAYLERGGIDSSAVSPEALAAAQGQWEGERRGVGGLPGVGGDQSSLSGRGSGFAPESQQKQGGGGFWNKLGKVGLGIGSVALPMVTGGLSLPVQAAIGAGMGAAGGALGGGGASGAAKGAALGAGGSLLGGWLRGGQAPLESSAIKEAGSMIPGAMQAPGSMARSPSFNLPPPTSSVIPNIVGGISSGPPRPPSAPTPNVASIRGGPMPQWTGGLPEGMEFNPVSPPSSQLPPSAPPFDLSQQAGIPPSATIPNVVGGIGMGRGGFSPLPLGEAERQSRISRQNLIRANSGRDMIEAMNTGRADNPITTGPYAHPANRTPPEPAQQHFQPPTQQGSSWMDSISNFLHPGYQQEQAELRARADIRSQEQMLGRSLTAGERQQIIDARR